MYHPQKREVAQLHHSRGWEGRFSMFHIRPRKDTGACKQRVAVTSRITETSARPCTTLRARSPLPRRTNIMVQDHLSSSHYCEPCLLRDHPVSGDAPHSTLRCWMSAVVSMEFLRKKKTFTPLIDTRTLLFSDVHREPCVAKSSVCFTTF